MNAAQCTPTALHIALKCKPHNNYMILDPSTVFYKRFCNISQFQCLVGRYVLPTEQRSCLLTE